MHCSWHAALLSAVALPSWSTSGHQLPLTCLHDRERQLAIFDRLWSTQTYDAISPSITTSIAAFFFLCVLDVCGSMSTLYDVRVKMQEGSSSGGKLASEVLAELAEPEAASKDQALDRIDFSAGKTEILLSW